MTELKDELKIRPGEGAAEYGERTRETLESHYQETGERLHPTDFLPGETPGELIKRSEKLLESYKIERATRERREQAEKPNTREEKNMTTVREEGARRFRVQSQERDVERAAAEFEAAKKRLFRTDGSKVFGEEEHRERLGDMVSGLREKVAAVATEAAADAEGYEREALALTYVDPASQVSASERGRLESSRAFVKEDCEAMAVPALAERIAAVSAGSDKAAKVLHARYGRRRIEALDSEANRLAREGRPAGGEVARKRRQLEEAVSSLEESLKDPKAAAEEQALKEAAAESRRVGVRARSRLSEADGSTERARQEHAKWLKTVF